MSNAHFYSPQAIRNLNPLLVTAFLFFMSIGFVGSVTATDQPAGELVIKIIGLTSNEGQVRVAIFDTEEQWLEKSVYAKVLSIKDRTCTWQIENIPDGNYGIAVFHDQNDNAKNDENFMGIPKEPYGFSNNARGSFGPPNWKKVSFAISAPTTEIEIKLK